MAILKKKSNGEFSVENGKKKATTTAKYLIVSRGGKVTLKSVKGGVKVKAKHTKSRKKSGSKRRVIRHRKAR